VESTINQVSFSCKFEITEIGGYYRKGGYDYLTKIIPIMEKWNLYEWLK